MSDGPGRPAQLECYEPERAAMNVHPVNDFEVAGAVPLSGSHGELLSVSITAAPRDLENLLDRLGQSQYPIDPQIFHDAQIDGRSVTLVEFPAYPGWIPEISQLLEGHAAFTVRKCMAHSVA